MHSTWSLAAFGFAGGGTLALGLIALAPVLKWVDHPDWGRKSHARPTARTGGLALWGLIVLGQCLGWLSLPLDRIEWLGIHAMALVGALDDRFNLRPRYKALVGLSVALLLSVHAALFLSHAVAHVEFVGLTLPTWPVLLLPFLAAWFWGIPQAYNLIDGINGLSMGFGLLALGILGWHLPTQPALMWGGLSAVLLLNFPRAKHFLGDCGALMLGTLFAALAVNLLVARDADLPVWLFAYPIVDVTLVVAIRRWRRQPLGSADRSHLHHWMMDRVGQRSWLATPILLTLAVLPMLRLVDGTGMRALSLIGAVALGGLALKAFLDRILPDPTSIPVAQVRREIPLMPRSETSETSRVQPIP